MPPHHAPSHEMLVFRNSATILIHMLSKTPTIPASPLASSSCPESLSANKAPYRDNQRPTRQARRAIQSLKNVRVPASAPDPSLNSPIQRVGLTSCAPTHPLSPLFRDMGRHLYRSSATATPTVQTLRRIRALSEDHDLTPEEDCEKAKARCRKRASWEWEHWDFSVERTGVGLLGSGIELEIGAGLERIGGKIPGYKGTAGEWGVVRLWDEGASRSFGVPSSLSSIHRGGRHHLAQKKHTLTSPPPRAPAFLSTLRQNLALTTSLLPPDSPTTTASTMSSPPSLHSSTTLPPPSPLSASPLTPHSSTSSESPSSTPSTTPLTTPTDALPPLTTVPATTAPHKHAALRLLADALAQRRQLAAALVIRSAPFAALAALALGILFQTMYTGRASLPLIGTTFAGVAMALLVAVRWLAGGYLALAERVGWDWLGEDEVWVTLWGTEEEVVGAVVVRTEREGKRRRRGVVRGWTVRLRERGRGVGRGLLEVVARVGRERAWEGVGVEEGGLYDERVLPRMFHAEFERSAARGRALLEEVWVESGGRKRSR
ncbi:hypothetical protein MMC18_004673 [Xylographa bjoerkii]|nr:hypothetical protein [Xylographa bjoerkii]